MTRGLIACISLLALSLGLAMAQEKVPQKDDPAPPTKPVLPPGGPGGGTAPGFPGIAPPFGGPGPGLGGPGRPESYKDLIPVLIDSLKDADGDIRTNAAAALSSIGQEAIEPMLDILKDKNEDKDVRANIVQILGDMGFNANDALPVLMKCLKDKNEDKEVRKRSAFAIQRICKENNNQFGGFGGVPPGAFGGGFGFGPGGVVETPAGPGIKPVDPGLLLPSKPKDK
jgi:hypothetical protein